MLLGALGERVLQLGLGRGLGLANSGLTLLHRASFDLGELGRVGALGLTVCLCIPIRQLLLELRECGAILLCFSSSLRQRLVMLLGALCECLREFRLGCSLGFPNGILTLLGGACLDLRDLGRVHDSGFATGLVHLLRCLLSKLRERLFGLLRSRASFGKIGLLGFRGGQRWTRFIRGLNLLVGLGHRSSFCGHDRCRVGRSLCWRFRLFWFVGRFGFRRVRRVVGLGRGFGNEHLLQPTQGKRSTAFLRFRRPCGAVAVFCSVGAVGLLLLRVRRTILL